MTLPPRNPPATETVWNAAVKVLLGNDAGDWTRPAPQLYPHQWSWDSAFCAIGWAHVDLRRAMREQQRLFAAQWRTGKIPYIVYDDTASESYFPDSARWGCRVSPDAPDGPPTGGLCQPPVHALALSRIWDLARPDPEQRGAARRYLRRIYPAVLAWHRYLATVRDPEGSGLVTVYHPWESGCDNSPRWDTVLNSFQIGDLPPYVRRDTRFVEAAQRPSDRDYRRYLWLLELMKRRHYDESLIARHHPFKVKDVFFSSIFVAANEALLELCDVVDAPAADRELVAGWAQRGQAGVAASVDPDLGLSLDYDVRAGAWLRSRTFAGLAPLIAGYHTATLIAQLDSAAFLGNPGLHGPLLASTSPLDDAFEPRNYWRGPTWPVINWLFWRALRRAGDHGRAQRLRAAALDLADSDGFFEYYDPRTGEPLGSPDQSWSAAVTLDWLAAPDA